MQDILCDTNGIQQFSFNNIRVQLRKEHCYIRRKKEKSSRREEVKIII